jgi:hypothetical protein
LVLTPKRVCVGFYAVQTTPDKQKLAASGNLTLLASILGTNTIDTQSIIKAEIPGDDGIRRRFPPP